MAIIGQAKGPYTLSALTDTLSFGPGAIINLDLSDIETIVMRISSTTGTFQLRGEISLDGNIWIGQTVSTLQGIPLGTVSASSIDNIYRTSTTNIPYFRLAFVSYTDGIITVKDIFSYRTATR